MISDDTLLLASIPSTKTLQQEIEPTFGPLDMSSATVMASPNDAAPSSPALSELHDRLDALWISHLRHLNNYTAAQKALQQHLRSGFFALSRANFNARPGMRYGNDYYHDRAVATKRVEVFDEAEGEHDATLSMRIISKSFAQDVGDQDDEDDRSGSDDPQQQPSPPATPEPDEKDSDDSADGLQDEPKASEKDSGSTPDTSKTSKPPLEADPLRWYGILVPRELRSAKTSFTSAVDETVANATNASRAMREVEVDIRRLRKEIRKVEKTIKG